MAKDMKEMEMCNCNCSGHGMWGGKHLYMLVGTLALVYGLVNWARVTYMWPPYMGWVVGGVVLILVGWFKKWLWMRKGM